MARGRRAGEVTPEPVAEVAPEPIVDVVPEPEPEVASEPVAEVEPIASVTPFWETPAPEPAAEVVPEPEPTPHLHAVPDAEPASPAASNTSTTRPAVSTWSSGLAKRPASHSTAHDVAGKVNFLVVSGAALVVTGLVVARRGGRH